MPKADVDLGYAIGLKPEEAIAYFQGSALLMAQHGQDGGGAKPASGALAALSSGGRAQ